MKRKSGTFQTFWRNEMDKWVYELIVEKIPPFSLLKGRHVTTFQLLLMLFVGIGISLYYKLPLRSLIMGGLTILVVVIWSRLTLIIAPTIRAFRPSLSEEENGIIEWYRDLLFNPRRPELFAGLAIFIPLLTYLYLNPYLIRYYLGDNPVVIAFAIVLAWDVAYRAGIGIWVYSLCLLRSFRLFNASKRRKGLEHTLLNDLKAMERMDRRGVAYGLTALLLFPVLSPDKHLTVFVIIYSLSLITFSILSISLIRQVPWLPPDITELLERAKFAYVGHEGEDFPHITPVVQVFDGRNVYFVTSKASKKFKLLKKNNRIAVLIDERDPKDFFGNKAVLIVGRARYYDLHNFIPNILKLTKVRNLFMEKYNQYISRYGERKEELPEAWRLTPILRRIPVEVEPEWVIYWRGARRIRIGL